MTFGSKENEFRKGRRERPHFLFFFSLNMSAPLARLERAEQHGDDNCNAKGAKSRELFSLIFWNGANFNHSLIFSSNKRKKTVETWKICHNLSDFITNRHL